MKKAGITFLLFVLILTGVVRVHSLISPVNEQSNKVISVKIETGSSSSTIARQLMTGKLIKSAKLFHYLVKFTGLDEQLQAGTYEFSPSQSMWEIINDLKNGKIATYKFTIPEGYTVDQIIQLLSALTGYQIEDFKQEVNIKSYINDFMEIPENNYNYVLEGFLFPDTYIIPVDYTPQQIIGVLVKHFKKKMNVLKEPHDLDYTPFEILTIASLIEKEAKLGKEKPMIAAVIYNRLNKDMLLQIDATIQYSLKERKEKISYEDLKVDSPYNTYLHKGLPPGPICNPGEKSIYAALNPADVDFLFYFAVNDGSHVFTKTYEKHLQLQEKNRQEAKSDRSNNNSKVNKTDD